MIGPMVEIDTTTRRGHPVVVATGEIDIKTAPKFESVLDRYSAEELVVDLSGVDFIDSTGLRVLARARSRLAGEGGRLVVCAPEGVVRRTMSLAGLTADFDIVSSVEELEGAG